MMSHYARAQKVRTLLEVATQVEVDRDLLERAKKVQSELQAMCICIEMLINFRIEANISNPVKINFNALRQSLNRFSSALSRSSSAVQQQPAVDMITQLKAYRRYLRKATRSEWERLFSHLVPLLGFALKENRASDATLRRAKKLAGQLHTARAYDPVEKLADVERCLGVSGVSACLAAIAQIERELQSTVDVIYREVRALTPEVRELLEKAGSEDGFPLMELTPQLLANLKEAGVLGSLFLRRV